LPAPTTATRTTTPASIAAIFKGDDVVRGSLRTPENENVVGKVRQRGVVERMGAWGRTAGSLRQGART
jgi:hypothetical protein